VLHVPVYEEDDDDDEDDAPPVIGMEGVVSGIGPVHDPPGWSFSVWLPELERVWGFDESDLGSLGLIEVEEDEPGSRIPLDPETPPYEAFGAELGLDLFIEVGAGEAADTAGNAIAELGELVPVAHVRGRTKLTIADRQAVAGSGFGSRRPETPGRRSKLWLPRDGTAGYAKSMTVGALNSGGTAK